MKVENKIFRLLVCLLLSLLLHFVIVQDIFELNLQQKQRNEEIVSEIHRDINQDVENFMNFVENRNQGIRKQK